MSRAISKYIQENSEKFIKEVGILLPIMKLQKVWTLTVNQLIILKITVSKY